jgi:signal transduction histidine kinase
MPHEPPPPLRLVPRDVPADLPRPTITLPALRALAAVAERTAGAAAARTDERRVALERLRRAIPDPPGKAAFDDPDEAYEPALGEFRAAIALAEDLVRLLEQDVRAPLTIIKIRAQLLLRQARQGPPSNDLLVRRLAEIDAAVDRIVSGISRRLDTPPPSHSGDESGTSAP